MKMVFGVTQIGIPVINREAPTLVLQEGVGPYRKPDAKLFRPTGKNDVLRQNIYNLLSSSPEKEFPLSEVEGHTKTPYRAVYRAIQALCKAGLISRLGGRKVIVKLTPLWQKKGKTI